FSLELAKTTPATRWIAGSSSRRSVAAESTLLVDGQRSDDTKAHIVEARSCGSLATHCYPQHARSRRPGTASHRALLARLDGRCLAIRRYCDKGLGIAVLGPLPGVAH